MKKSYHEELIVIKDYLKQHGVEVDEVTLWQGGFVHKGTSLGLPTIATVKIGEKEERYCVPSVTALCNDFPKFLKIEDGQHI